MDRLYASAAIDRQAYEAAQGFRRAYEVAGSLPASPIARLGTPAVAGREDAIARRLDAARRVRRIRAQLGPDAFTLVVAVTVEDASRSALGRQLSIGSGDCEAGRREGSGVAG